MVRARPGSQEGAENAASMSGRTLKWDYSGIGLIDVPTSGFQGLDKEKTEIGASAGIPGNASALALRQGSCSQYITQLKNCKLRPGSKAGGQGSLLRDCRGRFTKSRNHAQRLKPSYAQWKKGLWQSRRMWTL
ncbi:hypothetical protein NDU88_003898 [Pleurodeles waltl]|uniref:Uncharacterized protein n=1 Tax=Pleurodeles waltl TaxID=8319 RepID=A0AAV7NJJ8_PLEWA|nr:hypothetical protein NDU88_003898 [Pleurodeles waltl]